MKLKLKQKIALRSVLDMAIPGLVNHPKHRHLDDSIAYTCTLMTKNFAIVYSMGFGSTNLD